MNVVDHINSLRVVIEMFIEVYTVNDKEKLLQKGFKLIKEVQISNGTKYVFANTDKLKFDKSEVKCSVTNRLTF